MIRLSIPSIGVEEQKAVNRVLKSGFLVQGKSVAEFEHKIADYLKVKYAVAVNSGTSALHLSLLALGLGPGDEVIVPDFTFPATANVVELTGAKCVVVDIDPVTFNIDPKAVEKSITKKTKAIIPVHLFGQSADLDPVIRIARKYKLAVIEDAACVLGAEYKGRKCGTIGDAGCFSFHPRKILTTGEGGIIVTHKTSVAERLKLLRNHGMVRNGNEIDFVTAGFNYRMTEIQAAMGLVQLRRLPGAIAARRKAAQSYKAALSLIPWIKTPEVPSSNAHVYQAYIVQIPNNFKRDLFIAYLRQKGIEANFGTYALHRLSYYKKKYGLKTDGFPVTEEVFNTAIALPLFETLTARQINKIAAAIRQFPWKA